MQFAGLKERLKKKKEEAKASTGTVPDSTTAAPLASPSSAVTGGTPSSSDPYAAALRSALASNPVARHNEKPVNAAQPSDSSMPSALESSARGEKDTVARKRSRSPDEPQEGPNDTWSNVAPPTPSRVLLSKAECESQRATMLAALRACTAHVSSFMWTDKQCRAPLAIPGAMQEFLLCRYVRQSESLGIRPEETEHSALHAALSELTSTAVSADATAASTKQQKEEASTTEDAMQSDEQELRALIHALWYLATSYWHTAILGHGNEGSTSPTPTHQSAELITEFGAIRGWCFPVYLLAHHALPDVMRFTCGRETATCLEAWRAARRSVDGVLELLTYLLVDLESVRESRVNGGGGGGASLTKPQKTEPAATEASPPLVVPLHVRQGLYKMICTCTQQAADFHGARQAYTDLAMGNANWKLGLFSAGQVHMRRSVEKLERNKMTHVLNNERAMRLLHAARELVLFAEREFKRRGGEPEDRERLPFREQFFLSSSPTHRK